MRAATEPKVKQKEWDDISLYCQRTQELLGKEDMGQHDVYRDWSRDAWTRDIVTESGVVCIDGAEFKVGDSLKCSTRGAQYAGLLSCRALFT